MSLVGGVICWAHGVWTRLNESDPAFFDQGHMLDDPSEAELAGCRSQPGLSIGQARDGAEQEIPVLVEGIEEVVPLERGHVGGGGVDRHGSAFPGGALRDTLHRRGLSGQLMA